MTTLRYPSLNQHARLVNSFSQKLGRTAVLDELPDATLGGLVEMASD